MGPVLFLALSFSYLNRLFFTNVGNYFIIVVNEIHSASLPCPTGP